MPLRFDACQKKTRKHAPMQCSCRWKGHLKRKKLVFSVATMALSDAQLGFILSICAGAATGLGAAVVFSERLVKMASKEVLAARRCHCLSFDFRHRWRWRWRLA